MLLDEGVIDEVRIGTTYPVDFRSLAAAEAFSGIEAPRSFEKTLPSQYFVNSCDAASEAICHIEDRRIHIGDFRI